MAHQRTMTREYADMDAFRVDEQQLGQQGWSVDSTNSVDAKKGMVQRILARFTPVQPEQIVVTYSRPIPS